METLRSEGILHNHLFRVDGELVGHYNRALQACVGLETRLLEFYVDSRGESPEIEAELGRNYLQNGPANRYVIVVSPSQREAGLLHEEFSYDRLIFSRLYKNHSSSIGIATRFDSLYGELEDTIEAYRNLGDLLRLRNVVLSLDTPTEFIAKARELHKLRNALLDNPDLIIEHDAAVPRKMLTLIEQVGDIRKYNVHNIKVDLPVGTFYTRLFNGVYVFRDLGGREPVDVHRPTQKETTVLSLNDLSHTSRDIETVVIHSGDQHDCDGPRMELLSLVDKQSVVDFLVRHNYASFSTDLFSSRLTRLEDMTLLSESIPVGTLPTIERKRLLADRSERMPHEWSELQDLQAELARGFELPDAVRDKSSTVQAMLLAPVRKRERVIVQNLLTRLWPQNFELMRDYNSRDLEHSFEEADTLLKEYIIQVLKEDTHHGTIE